MFWLILLKNNCAYSFMWIAIYMYWVPRIDTYRGDKISMHRDAPVNRYTPILQADSMTASGSITVFNTLRPRQDGRHFADDIFTCNFFNENCCILIKFSLKYVRKGPIDNNPALVQIMTWRRSGDKPLSEPMMISLLTHICVTWPQWIKHS